MIISDLKLRNPVIARVFRELKLIEQWGSGVCNILRAVAELKLPEPLVQEIGMRVGFCLPGKVTAGVRGFVFLRKVGR